MGKNNNLAVRNRCLFLTLAKLTHRERERSSRFNTKEKIIKKPSKQEPLRQKKYPRLKELRDVMGGEAAWENADSMEEQCTKDGCDNRNAFFIITFAYRLVLYNFFIIDFL